MPVTVRSTNDVPSVFYNVKVSSILSKLGLERRTQAAVLAAKLLR